MHFRAHFSNPLICTLGFQNTAPDVSLSSIRVHHSRSDVATVLEWFRVM